MSSLRAVIRHPSMRQELAARRAERALRDGRSAEIPVPVFLADRVLYVHADGKTWEAVPLHLFVVTQNGRRVPVIRIGRNAWTLKAGLVTYSGNKQCWEVSPERIDDTGDGRQIDRQRFWDAEHAATRADVTGPLLEKHGDGCVEERFDWAEHRDRVRRIRSAGKRYAACADRRMAAWRRSPAGRTEAAFVRTITPIVLRGRRAAKQVYAALCNMRWRRLVDGKVYSCAWRHAGAIIADIRNKAVGANEIYLDWYCSGREGEVAPAVASFMKRAGYEPLPWPKEDQPMPKKSKSKSSRKNSKAAKPARRRAGKAVAPVVTAPVAVPVDASAVPVASTYSAADRAEWEAKG